MLLQSRKNRSIRSIEHATLSRSVAAVIEGLEDRRLLSAALTLQNLDGGPTNNRLIFNKVQNQNATLGDTFHDTSMLRLNNTGDQPLVINSVNISGPWQLLNGSVNGTTIPVGAHLDLSVHFTQNTVPPHSTNEENFTASPMNGGAAIQGAMTISSNDAVSPNQTVSLAGYWQNRSENNNEPALSTIVNLLAGYTTAISYPSDFPGGQTQVDLKEQSLAVDGVSAVKYYGEEIVSGYWSQANASQPATVQQLAAFHTQGNIAHLSWYAQDTDPNHVVTHTVLVSQADEGQSVLPHAANLGGALANTTFRHAGAFGFKIDNEYSDDSKNNTSKGGGHHIRFYPLRDAQGNYIANTYLMALDYAVLQIQNYDFQDNVYIVSNVRPVSAPPAPTGLTAGRAGSTVNLSWNAITGYSTLTGYNVYRSTSLNGVYTLLNGSPLGAANFTDSSAPLQKLYYKVRAIDNTNGTISAPAGLQVNAPPSTNGGPVANDDTFSATTAVAAVVNVLNNDADTSSTAVLLPSTLTITHQPSHGTVSVDPSSGLLTYTSNAGFTGTDTLNYTISDSQAATSNAATVTFNVSSAASNSPVANNDTGKTLANTPVTIDVLANDYDTATIVPGSVAVTVNPTHGTFSVDAITGAITYTPEADFVGSDKLKYTFADSRSATSNTATVNINVGVAIGIGANRSLTFTDGSGVTVISALSGLGVGNFYFNGTGSVTTARHAAVVNGSGLFIDDINLSGTTNRSTLYLRTRGGSRVSTVGGITDTDGLGRLIAPGIALTNTNTDTSSSDSSSSLNAKLDLAGISVLQLNAAAAAQINLGSANAVPAMVYITTLDGSSLNSAVAIRSLVTRSWAQTAYSLLLTAPSVTSLSVVGDFDADMNLTGTGLDLVAARVGGNLGGTWSMAGSARSVYARSASNAWGANIAGTLTSMYIRSGGMSSDLNAGSIGVLTVVGDITGNITTSSILALRVIGNINTSTIDLTGAGISLRYATVTGAIAGSTIATVGDVVALAAGSMSSSTLNVGAVAGTTELSANLGNIGSATLRSLRLSGRGAAFGFAASNVLAHTIGAAALGSVNGSNSGTGFGIAAAAGSIRALTFNEGGVRARMAAKQLADNTTVATYFSTVAIVPGDFAINLV